MDTLVFSDYPIAVTHGSLRFLLVDCLREKRKAGGSAVDLQSPSGNPP